MIIDVHGHYTTAPRSVQEWRQKQIAAFPEPYNEPFVITNDEIVETITNGQLKLQQDRGTDVALFSPTAGGMAHHYGDEKTSVQWTRLVNDNIKKVCTLFPDNFIPVCQIPQSPGVSPKNCLEELEYRVLQEGFVGVNINLDPTDGYWTDPPLTDEWWYPLYEKMVELNIPGMIHTSMSCNPNFHGTGAHYLNGDTSAFMQFIQHQHPFDRFPTLQFVIPHGGGAVPYHWGRYRGIGLDAKKGEIAERLLQNVSFDTCVYHQIGINLLTEVIPADNIIFASEMIGAVRGTDPRTGRYFDDTKPYVDASPHLSAADKEKVFEKNARRVYPRLSQYLKA